MGTRSLFTFQALPTVFALEIKCRGVRERFLRAQLISELLGANQNWVGRVWRFLHQEMSWQKGEMCGFTYRWEHSLVPFTWRIQHR